MSFQTKLSISEKRVDLRKNPLSFIYITVLESHTQKPAILIRPFSHSYPEQEPQQEQQEEEQQTGVTQRALPSSS